MGSRVRDAKSIIVLGATLASAVGNASIAQNIDHGSDLTKCRENKTCTIEYDYLSEQESDPFLFAGIVMDADQPRWSQFRRSLRKFPSVRDCLVAEEQEKQKPNLLLIDWDRVGTGGSARVCIFRIARSLNDVERIHKWLAFHEFRVNPKIRLVGDSYVPQHPKVPVSGLTAQWTREQYRDRKPSLISSLFSFDLILSYQLVIEFSQDDEVAHVGLVTPTK